jgi:hypothetical protein
MRTKRTKDAEDEGANVVPVGQLEISDTPESAEPNGPNLPPVGDIFDNLEALRLKQDFNRVKVRKPFTLCPIRKPRDHEWFQSRVDYAFETTLFEHKEDMSSEWYLPVGADVLDELSGRSLHEVVIFLWVNRKSNCCIWPVRLADADGRVNSWHQSMRDVFTTYANSGSWIRIEAGDGGYQVELAENETLPDPAWPKLPLNEILRVAFKGGRVVDSLDHPLIQKLRGRV